MKLIETKGITYLEKFPESAQWYWGTDYTCGDLYEAEEVFRAGKRFEPNRLIFVHFPDGIVYEPVQAGEGQYFGRPACIDGLIYFLLVNFDENLIQIFQCSHNMETIIVLTQFSLNEVKDCYNLRIDGSPVMVTRQGGDNHFQIIWPEKVDFVIGERESFFARKDGKMYFSEWNEEDDEQSTYTEEVNVREYPTGKLIEKIPGSVMPMPGGENWIVR